MIAPLSSYFHRIVDVGARGPNNATETAITTPGNRTVGKRGNYYYYDIVRSYLICMILWRSCCYTQMYAWDRSSSARADALSVATSSVLYNFFEDVDTFLGNEAAGLIYMTA